MFWCSGNNHAIECDWPAKRGVKKSAEIVRQKMHSVITIDAFDV